MPQNNLKQNATTDINLNTDQDYCTFLAPNAGIKTSLDPAPILPAITAKAPSNSKKHEAVQTVGTNEKEESTKAVVETTKASTFAVREE